MLSHPYLKNNKLWNKIDVLHVARHQKYFLILNQQYIRTESGCVLGPFGQWYADFEHI